MKKDRFRVGVISSVHGIRGESKVFAVSGDPKRFADLKQVYAVSEGRECSLTIESVRYFKNMAICKFSGIETPEEMRKYLGMELWIDRAQAIPCEEGEYYIPDLIGLPVFTDEGEDLGKVSDLYPTGANYVLVVRTAEGTEILIPYIDEFVREISPEKEKIIVHLMDGLR